MALCGYQVTTTATTSANRDREPRPRTATATATANRDDAHVRANGSLRSLIPLLAALVLSASVVAAEAHAPAAAPAGSNHGAHPSAASAIPPVGGQPDSAGAAIPLRGYLYTGAALFAMGLTIIVARRNAIAILMGIELLMNAVGINFVAFSKYGAKDVVEGQVVTIFLIIIAAAEAAVALAIALNIYNNLKTVSVDEADALKG